MLNGLKTYFMALSYGFIRWLYCTKLLTLNQRVVGSNPSGVTTLKQSGARFREFKVWGSEFKGGLSGDFW